MLFVIGFFLVFIAALFLYSKTVNTQSKQTSAPAITPNSIGIGRTEEARKELQQKLLSGGAQILERQLSFCYANPDFSDKLDDNYVRGYLVGFFQSSLHFANALPNSFEEKIQLMLFAHIHLFGANPDDLMKYVAESLRRTESKDFGEGHDAGFSEYFELVHGSSRQMPTKLTRYFMHSSPSIPV